jgi:SAM-dependent methyltransferase/lysophospholipase L1-like esterase
VQLEVLAVSGARVGDVVDQQVPRITGRPDLILVSVGANDATHLTSLTDVADRYTRLLDRLPPGVPVVVLGVPDLGGATRLAQPLRSLAVVRGGQVDRIVRDLASSRGAAYVNLARETGPSFRADPDANLAADHYHPSDAGYAVWADAITPVVTWALERAAHPDRPAPPVPGGVPMTERPTIHEAAAVGFDPRRRRVRAGPTVLPDAAVQQLVAELDLRPGRRVLDLAAGTGTLTRLLRPSGADLVAVEPVAGMRAVLADAVPGVEVHDGTAEAIPLPDASVDAVVCAQAFHWFDAPRALTEIGRVLGPGGGLAVVFNIRDDDVPWVGRLTALTGVHDAPPPHHIQARAAFAGDVAAAGLFGPVVVSRFRYEQVLDEEGLVERVRSQSWIGAMGAAEQGALLDRVRELARADPDLAGRDSFVMPYDTEVAICRRH